VPIDHDTQRRLRQAMAQLNPPWDVTASHGFSYLSGGYSNENYRFEVAGEAYVIRLPRQYQDETGGRQLEQTIYREPGALRVPALVAMDTDSGLLISRWVEGPLLIEQPPTTSQLLAYLRNIASALGERPASSGTHYDPVAVSQRRLEIAPGEIPNAVAACVARLNWQPEHIVWCHNDLNPWNVIAPSTDPRSWVTLDWEWPALNDPLFDVVTLHQGLGRDPTELDDIAEAVMERTIDSMRVQQNLLAFWLREYGWAFGRWHAGDQRAEIAEQMRRAQASLDRALV
tara:strand:+ start:181 stop:1038 length:858 start_codon:yes stop_codon:yes gene_type:complete